MVKDIAPPQKELSIKERISEVEKFLGKEEEKIKKEAEAKKLAIIQTPTTTPKQKLKIGDTSNPNNEEVVRLLGRIIEDQNIERKSWERNNPLITDSPIYDWAEETIDPGFLVSFTLIVPEGQVFFFEYFNITYNADTIYNVVIDGTAEPTTIDTIQDFGDHNPFFKPPRMCYEQVAISALNNGVIAQTYGVFMRGWFRQTIKIDKEYVGSR